MTLKKYQKITSKIRKNFKKKSAKKFNKNDEELFRNKVEFLKIEFPRAHSEVKAELRAKKSSLNNQDSFELIESASKITEDTCAVHPRLSVTKKVIESELKPSKINGVLENVDNEFVTE